MSSARNVLERSTIMLLTSTKLCLRHPECAHSKENRDTVFCQMRRAMDLIHHVVKDGVLSAFTERRSRSNDQTIEWDTDRGTASSCLHVFARLMENSRPRFETSCLKDPTKSRNESMHSAEHADIINERRELMRSNSERDRHMTNHHHHRSVTIVDSAPTEQSYEKQRVYFKRNDMNRNEVVNIDTSILSPQVREDLMVTLDKFLEKTQDFTDSAYTTHEHRENILLLNDRIRLELNQSLRMAVNMEQFPNAYYDVDAAIDSVLAAAQDLSQQLSLAVADQTAELNHTIKTGIDLVKSLRNTALNQELDRLQEYQDQFHDNIDHILEVI